MIKITQRRRKQFFANQLHKEMFAMVCLASIVPLIITVVSLFFLIFGITADQIGIPETIIYNLLPAAQEVFSILVVVVPLSIAAVLFVAYKITHRMIGPFDRIVRELGEHIAGKGRGPIMLRKNDKFWPLVEKINLLLKK